MATITNPFGRINPNLGTSQRQSVGEGLANIVSASLQAYGKVKEIDKKYDEEQDAELGESELIAYNNNADSIAQSKLDNNYSGMTPSERMNFDQNSISQTQELTSGFKSTTYKKNKANWDNAFNKSFSDNKLVVQNELKTNFATEQIRALLRNPEASNENYESIYKSISAFKTGEPYSKLEFINKSKDSLKTILASIPDEEYNPSMGKDFAKGLLSYTKDKTIIDEINLMLETKENGFKKEYSSKFREDNFGLLYNADGLYNRKELKNFQKSLNGDENLTVEMKTSMFGRVDSLMSYLNSNTTASNKSIGINARIDITNELDKLIDSSAINGENVSNDLIQNVSNRLSNISGLTETQFNTLYNKLENVKFNNLARNKANEMIESALNGDQTALAEYMKATTGGISIDIGNGYTKNVTSSFFNAEISKKIQTIENEALNTFGYVETTNDKDVKVKTFDANKFQGEVLSFVKTKEKLQADSPLITNIANKLKKNSSLSANTVEGYYKLMMIDSINKQHNNEYEESDRYRNARLQIVYNQYKESTDKDKDNIFLPKILAAKNEAYELNKGRSYQAKLTKNILEATDYAEDREGWTSWVVSNTTIDDRSLTTYQSWINAKGSKYETLEKVQKNMYEKSMDIDSKIFSAPSRVFIPDGSTEEQVNKAIEGALKLDLFGATVELGDITAYNRLSVDGNIDIVLERNDTNGVQSVVLNKAMIKKIAEDVVIRRRNKRTQGTNNKADTIQSILDDNPTIF